MSDTRETALKALKRIIENGNLGFKSVLLNPRGIEQYTPEKFPVCQIYEGASMADHTMTDTELERLQVGIAIIYKRQGDENSERSETWARDIMDDLKNLLAENVQLDDTCDYLLAQDTAPPLPWETVNDKYRYMTYIMQLRRNFGGA